MSTRYKILIFVCALFVLLRLLLPVGIRYSINQHLKTDMEYYAGSIDKFKISFYRGAYQIEGLRIWKKDRAYYDPILAVDKIEVSLLSHLLMEKKILGSLEITRARLNIIDSIASGDQQFGDDNDWRKLFSDLVRLDLENVKVRNSQVLFANRDYKKPVQISIDKINASAINIRNSEKAYRKLPGQLNLSARIQRDGYLRAYMQFDAQSALPSFIAKVDVSAVNLAKLNNTFILYGPFYFLNGEMGMYSQILVNEGNLRGYMTPFFKNVEAVPMNWNNRHAASVVSESVKAIGDVVMTKPSKKAHGRRYAFKGQMAMNEEVWTSFWSTVRNGFVKPPAKLATKRPLALRKKKNVVAEKEKNTNTLSLETKN